MLKIEKVSEEPEVMQLELREKEDIVYAHGGGLIIQK